MYEYVMHGQKRKAALDRHAIIIRPELRVSCQDSQKGGLSVVVVGVRKIESVCCQASLQLCPHPPLSVRHPLYATLSLALSLAEEEWPLRSDGCSSASSPHFVFRTCSSWHTADIGGGQKKPESESTKV
ncbi:hypothetical protein LI328DRAFT_126431 [Trichoderma asperelloides]|nr:hypothetical protein LI328DRAFT_126431 [Trichoderma asperelloides]